MSDPLGHVSASCRCRLASASPRRHAGGRVSAVLAAARTGEAALPAPFLGEHARLPFAAATYEITGDGGPAVAVLGGISATRHLAAHEGDPSPGWWEAQVGPGRAIDTTRVRAIGIDYLGAGLREGDAVPLVSTADQARALAAVLDAAGVGRLHALVGASYGGMVALAFAALFPDRAGQVVVLSAAHQPHPMATAVRAVQRRVVRDGVACGRGREALALARALAMTTYRTGRELAGRFGGGWTVDGEGAARFEVEAYLDHQGSRYARRFTPERFLCLSQSIDLHRVDPAAVTVPCTLLAVRGDPIAPAWQVAELATRLAGPCTRHELDSIYGHDAFLKEDDAVASLLTHALGQETRA